MFKPSRYPGSNPEDAFKQALEDIRYSHSKRGEVPQVRNLISPYAIRRLNTVAATQYDDNFGIVRFYGGMIHRFPTATFDVVDGATKASRTTSRELADFLIVVVFSEADAHGAHVVTGRRASLVQAKLDCSPSGAQVFNLDPTTQDIPQKTDEEQFYLLNQWPAFELSCAVAGQKFDLRSQDTSSRPLAKYCFLWDEPTAKTAQLPRSWLSSWQCANPEPSSPADTPLGSLLVGMIDSDRGYGKEFEAAKPMNDWDYLMNTLTTECSVSTWANEPKLVDPAGVSFIDGICAYATILQHARSPEIERWRGPYFRSFWPSPVSKTPGLHMSEDSGMPVLVVSVSSFDRRERPEAHEPDTWRALDEAAYKLHELRRL